MSKASDYKKADLIWDIKYFISSYFFGFPKELVLYFKSLFASKTTPKTKFIIFSTGRTGSTLLTSLLNSNTDIYCDGEILKHRYLRPLKVLDKHAKKTGKPIYGFKLLTHHIKDIQWGAKKNGKQFLQKLLDDGYKIIYLERKHRLNQSLSMMYAILRNDWHKKQGKNSSNQQKQKLHVDLQTLDWWLNGFDELNTYEKNVLKGIPHVHVVYEEDLANPQNHQATMDKVCSFLGIKKIVPQTTLRKITPKKYEDFIENAQEMIAHLRQTPHGTYVAEDNQIKIPEESNQHEITR